MIETITTSFVVVWIVVAILTLLLFIAAANDSFAAAFWFSVIGLAVLQLVTAANPWGWVADNPKTFLACAAAYIPIGIGWSLFRWLKLLKSSAVNILKDKDSFTPNAYYASWEVFVAKRFPNASKNKDRIICWIVYWPFSVLAYLLLDFLREFGNWIYDKISGIYKAMADRVKDSLL